MKCFLRIHLFPFLIIKLDISGIFGLIPQLRGNCDRELYPNSQSTFTLCTSTKYTQHIQYTEDIHQSMEVAVIQGFICYDIYFTVIFGAEKQHEKYCLLLEHFLR